MAEKFCLCLLRKQKITDILKIKNKISFDSFDQKRPMENLDYRQKEKKIYKVVAYKLFLGKETALILDEM